MTKSATRIQDKDTQKRLSVVQSTADPTKYGIVILNPDGSPISGGGGDARVFSLSSTSDLTNAQKAYNFLGRGKFPIIKYDGKFYLYAYGASNAAYFTVWNEKTIDSTSNSSFAKDGIKFDISSGNVTAINVVTVATSDSGFLRTGKNYGTPYTPEYDGSPATKKYVDDKVDNTAFGSGWSGETGVAPSKDSVYTKINSMDNAINGNTSDISTINSKIPSEATSSNQLADKNYVNDGINSVTAYYITKNAQGDQWSTRAELFAATTFYSGGVVRVPTKNDYTIVLSDENHDNATTRYIYNSGWEYQYTVNETALTQAQLNAVNSGITSGKVSTYDGYATTIANKVDKLSAGSLDQAYIVNTSGTQTSYNVSQGASSGAIVRRSGTQIIVPTTPTDNTHATSKSYVDSGLSGKQATLVSGTNIKTINGNSVLGSGNLTISGLPSGGTNGQIIMMVSGTPTWVTPTAQGFKMIASNSPLTVPYDWYGTEAQYSSATKSSDTEYRTI